MIGIRGVSLPGSCQECIFCIHGDGMYAVCVPGRFYPESYLSWDCRVRHPACPLFEIDVTEDDGEEWE